jgi:tetratricopeptide (TPR) repeat protein
MDFLSGGVDPQSMFISSIQQSQQMEQLANTALSKGMDLYRDGKYNEAADAFRRSVALSPTSPYAQTSADYMASSYIKIGRIDKAVDAYKTSMQLDPTSDAPVVKLANLYFAEGRHQEALTQYEKAVRLNPSAVNYFSLGQAHLARENFLEAESAFSRVQRMEPHATNGYYGLGQVYNKMERYDDAVFQFKTAIEKDKDFFTAYAELGYNYADMGKMDEAQEMVAFLEENDADLADTLSRYMYKVDPPQIMFASSSGNFPKTLPMRPPLSVLDSYLTNANATQTFTMELQFSKKMDRESVENIYNWSITRASGDSMIDKYNFGFSIPDTEVAPKAYPDFVYYDDRNLTAKLTFSIQQNDTADGTIDPSHIVFKFNGEDVYGNKMNPDFDEYSGFSGVA